MTNKKINALLIKSEKRLKLNTKLHNREFGKKAHKSLFRVNYKYEQLRREKLKTRYFSQAQMERLAAFLSLPDSRLSMDEFLAYCSINLYKSQLQKILAAFVHGQVDSIQTVKQLECFCAANKPFSWQLWKLFEQKRFQKLHLFIEDFKCNCLKEVLQTHTGYHDAPNLYHASNNVIKPEKQAANKETTTKSYLSLAYLKQDKQKNSLFINFIDETKEEIPHATLNKNMQTDQAESFFRGNL